jgi:hypothetical protein
MRDERESFSSFSHPSALTQPGLSKRGYAYSGDCFKASATIIQMNKEKEFANKCKSASLAIHHKSVAQQREKAKRRRREFQ